MANRYQVFGELTAFTEDGSSLHVTGRQASILAILLASHPNAVTAGLLIEEIWGDELPKDPEAALHSAVSRLRRVIEDDLVTTRVGYSMDLADLDSRRFGQAAATALSGMRLEDFETAMRLWAGDPYRGFEDHPTVALEIERLRQAHRRISQEWHRLLVEEGRAEEAVATLKLAVTEDPFDEGALGLYMRALAASGRKPEALKVFREYERRLAEETGLEPSVAVRELEIAILVDELPIPEPPSRQPVPMDISVSYVSRSRGERVAVGRVGSGPAIFVHPGWLSALDQISSGLDPRSPFWSELSKTHELTIFDRYGTGLSKGDPKDVSFETSVEELKTLLRQTTVGPVPLWAASGAGPICIKAAIDAPELVSHLILYATYASGPATFSQAAASSMTSLIRNSWGVGSDVLSHMLFPGGSAEQRDGWAKFQRTSTSADLASKLITQLYQADVSGILDRLELPCLVIHYQGDKGVPVAGGEQLARGIPGAQFVLLEGISHYPLPGEETRVVEIVDRFLAATDV